MTMRRENVRYRIGRHPIPVYYMLRAIEKSQLEKGTLLFVDVVGKRRRSPVSNARMARLLFKSSPVERRVYTA